MPDERPTVVSHFPSSAEVAGLAAVAEIRRCAALALIAYQAGRIGAQVDPVSAVVFGTTADAFRQLVLEAAASAAASRAAAMETSS